VLTALLRIGGWLLVIAGLACMVLIATGAADTWLEENWTCATGGGPNGGIARERNCGWLEAEWSALVLSGAAAFGGLIILVIASVRSDPQSERQPMTIDLSRLRRK
jgi:hypothetical protein